MESQSNLDVLGSWSLGVWPGRVHSVPSSSCLSLLLGHYEVSSFPPLCSSAVIFALEWAHHCLELQTKMNLSSFKLQGSSLVSQPQESGWFVLCEGCYSASSGSLGTGPPTPGSGMLCAQDPRADDYLCNRALKFLLQWPCKTCWPPGAKHSVPSSCSSSVFSNYFYQ